MATGNGNGKGKGNEPIGEWMARLRAALFEAVTEDDVREIAEGLVRRAKEGDLQATRMLFSYVMGGMNVNVKQAVIVQQHGGGLAPLPARPVPALPGTATKLAAMEKRARNGQPLCHPGDGRYGGEDDNR